MMMIMMLFIRPPWQQFIISGVPAPKLYSSNDDGNDDDGNDKRDSSNDDNEDDTWYI